MLTLSRFVGEAIIINENITITIVKNDRGKIRISIDAPKDVPIRRAELPPLEKHKPIS